MSPTEPSSQRQDPRATEKNSLENASQGVLCPKQ